MEAQNSKDNQSNPEQKNLLEAPSHRPQVTRQSHCDRNSIVIWQQNKQENMGHKHACRQLQFPDLWQRCQQVYIEEKAASSEDGAGEPSKTRFSSLTRLKAKLLMDQVPPFKVDISKLPEEKGGMLRHTGMVQGFLNMTLVAQSTGIRSTTSKCDLIKLRRCSTTKTLFNKENCQSTGGSRPQNREYLCQLYILQRLSVQEIQNKSNNPITKWIMKQQKDVKRRNT